MGFDTWIDAVRKGNEREYRELAQWRSNYWLDNIVFKEGEVRPHHLYEDTVILDKDVLLKVIERCNKAKQIMIGKKMEVVFSDDIIRHEIMGSLLTYFTADTISELNEVLANPWHTKYNLSFASELYSVANDLQKIVDEWDEDYLYTYCRSY